MVAQPCGAGFDEISAAMMTSARKARKKRRAVMPEGYLSKCESLAIAGGLDLFPAKFTVLGCEEIRPSIKAVSAKHPIHPQISLDPTGTIVGFPFELGCHIGEGLL
jgi:hypothetical protein